MLVAALMGSCQGDNKLSEQLLKQATDTLIDTILPPLKDKREEYSARVPEPDYLDLSVRRLQVGLEAQVEDNWRALNEPQRWAILRDNEPVIKIIKSFRNIKEQVQQLQQHSDFDGIEAQLNHLQIQELEEKGDWIRYWDEVRKYIGQVGQLYTYFVNYVDNPADSVDNGLNDFVTSLAMSVTKQSSLQAMLTDLHRTVITFDTSLFSTLQSILSRNEEHLCLSVSDHLLIYNLYNIIALTEIKGYTMLQFSYMILKINNKGNFATEAEATKKNFADEAKEKLVSVKQVLPSLSRVFRRCDPESHVEEETFLQVKGFLQGYIENEVDMNEYGTCRAKCSEYTYAESKGCYKDMFCAKQRKCTGKIFDCEFYHADAWVCMSQDPERRYDWVEYEDGTSLGNTMGQCASSNKIKVDSWWRWVFWHCSYCLCKCDEERETSQRYWSLLPALANVQDGFIITGARLVRRGLIFHLQIQEARALPEGGVDQRSKEWVEPDTLSQANIAHNPKVFTMSYAQRAMDLDKLTAPDGHVLTGVKLRSIGGHLNLEIQVTPIKFTSGELLREESIWIANDNTPASTRPRKLLPIILPDIPTRLTGHNKVDGEHDEYIQFDTTSAYKDVAQTVIPFVDAQPVTQTSWLAGAGLYHKGRLGFGGFVGLSLETFDYSRHLLDESGGVEPGIKIQFVKAEGA